MKYTWDLLDLKPGIHYFCAKSAFMKNFTIKLSGFTLQWTAVFLLIFIIKNVSARADSGQAVNQRLLRLNKLSKKFWQVSLDSSYIYSKKAVKIVEQNHVLNEEAAKAWLYMAVTMFSEGRYDSAGYYAEKGLTVANKIRSMWGEGFANNLLCVIERRKSNFDKAVEYGLKAVEIRKQVKDTFNLAGAYQNLGNLYSQIGKPLKAIDYFSKSLELYLATSDTAGLIMTHGNIGNLYLDMKDREKGKEHILRSLALDKNKGLSYADGTVSLGTIYLEFDKKYDSAIMLFKEAKFIYKRIGIDDGIATADENIGLALIGSGRAKEARKKLKNAQRIYNSLGDSSQIASIMLSLGKYYISLGMIDSAEIYLNNALELSRKSKKSFVLNESLFQLYKINKKRGNVAEALEYFEEYSKTKDSLETGLLSTRLADMESKYQNVRKEQKIELLTHEHERLKWRETQFYYIIFTLAGFIVVGGLLVLQKRRKERQISLQQEKILKQEKQLAEQELETKRIKQQEMEQEILFKSKQLSTHALNMVQKNKMLRDVKQQLEEITRKINPEYRQNLKKINLLLARNMQTEKEWNLFKMYFEEVNQNFFKNLKNITPALSTNDLRHCALIKLNLNVKEAASLLNVSPHTVKSARYRLKKKLGLKETDSLNEFISKI